MKIARFGAKKSLYLVNGARWWYSYNGRLFQNRMCSTESHDQR